jgi:hypothetical protein
VFKSTTTCYWTSIVTEKLLVVVWDSWMQSNLWIGGSTIVLLFSLKSAMWSLPAYHVLCFYSTPYRRKLDW